jgi:hypothetical protein
MVLEAIEDHRRGWQKEKTALGGQRVPRAEFVIEHILPRKWEAHWPLQDDGRGGERDAVVHTIGNLTLLTSRLNSKVSNGPWLGETGKRHGLESHDVLLLNRDLLKTAGDKWTEVAIRQRSHELSTAIIEIWPVPEGHHCSFAAEKIRPRRHVDLSELMSAGRIQAGISLVPRRRKHVTKTATLLLDGRLDLAGVIYSSPSEAARAITGVITNGWSFFLVDQQSRRSLKDVRLEYLESTNSEDTDDDDDVDDES